MTQPPLANRISLAVQDFIYKVADDLTTIVDEALEAFEDAAARVEEKVTPTFTTVNNSIYVDGHGLMTADEIRETFKTAEQSPSQTGGRENTPPTLEETLSVVYDYLRDNNLLGEKVSSNKDNQVRHNKSGIAAAFKVAVARDIFGSAYVKGYENRF